MNFPVIVLLAELYLVIGLLLVVAWYSSDIMPYYSKRIFYLFAWLIALCWPIVIPSAYCYFIWRK
jgi:hypothetical protein